MAPALGPGSFPAFGGRQGAAGTAIRMAQVMDAALAATELTSSGELSLAVDAPKGAGKCAASRWGGPGRGISRLHAARRQKQNKAFSLVGLAM
ncbi:MAG: hypothetical protein J2P49_03390 [Methylocapsa sp.]|nr:hypothetical protein [Methylocapsa sp.]